jgi:hypothetical protein
MFITLKTHKRDIKQLVTHMNKRETQLESQIEELQEENQLLIALVEMNDQTEKNLLGEIEDLNAYIVRLEECSTDDLVDHLVDRRLSNAYDDLEIANKLEELEE